MDIRLTGTKKQVVELLAKGYSNKAIARILCMSEEAVRNHVHNVYDMVSHLMTDDINKRVWVAINYLELI